jgi:hypothetical protein
MNQCAARVSVHYFAVELVLDMDRENAIRLLEALMAAGKHPAPMARAWIKKKAWEIGLEGQELVSALAYAGNEGWITDGRREGWISLTSKGAATMRDLMRRTQRR